MGIEETLKRAEVFLGLDDEDLRKIAALPSCREETYHPGETIFGAGDKAKNLYVLKEGEVDLMMQARAQSGEEVKEATIEKITTGGFLGWSALVKPYSYTMSAISKKPSRVVVISGAELAALFASEPSLGYKVFQSLAHIIGARLRLIEQVMVRGQKWPFLKEKT